jgi:hypothetical protein
MAPCPSFRTSRVVACVEPGIRTEITTTRRNTPLRLESLWLLIKSMQCVAFINTTRHQRTPIREMGWAGEFIEKAILTLF